MLTTDELDRLHVQLRDTQEQRNALERQRDALVTDVRAQQHRADQFERNSVTLEEEKKQIASELSEARRKAEAVPLLEQRLQEETARAKNFRASLEGTQDDLTKARADVKRLEARLNDDDAELRGIKKELASANQVIRAVEDLRAGFGVILGSNG